MVETWKQTGELTMIILYYVYFDTISRWYTGPHGGAIHWHSAEEFTTREAAKEVADKLNGVVFGWVQ